MFDCDELRHALRAFLVAAAASEDATHPEVAARVETLSDAVAAWEAGGLRLPETEGALRAASNLQVAFHDLNPEGLPFSVRDASTEMLTLIDRAEENGFVVTAHDAHIADAAAFRAP